MNDPGFWTVFRRRVLASRDWTREDNALAVVIVLFAVSVTLDAVGVELWLLRPVIVVPVLTFVPGYLLLRIVGLQPRDVATGVLYALGLSLVFLMLYGFALNSFLPVFGIKAVFTEWTLFIAVLFALGGLYAVYTSRADPALVPVTRVAALWRPWALGLLSLPFVAVLGARLVTRFGNNAVLLGMLAGIGLLAVVAYLGILPKRLYPLAVVTIAAALLLHNSVLTHVLAWDAGKELRLANLVLENNIWDPTLGGKWMKNAMLRIVLLHPIYSLLSDIELLWEFKTVSPLLFAFAPLAFYKSYQTVVNHRDAFLAVLLPMSFFSFFTVLSWNSRTSGALLFLGLFALTVTDRSLSRRNQRLLAISFLFGLVVSHYAMAYMTLAAMPLVLVGNWILLGPRRTEKAARTTTIVVVLFGTFTLAWYMYIVYQAGAFSRLVTFSYGFFSDTIMDLFGPSQTVSAQDSTTAQYATTQYTSNTISWLKQLFIIVGACGGVGIGIQLLQRLRRRIAGNRPGERTVDETEIASTEYLLYATAFLGLFGLTFLGVSKLNTARTMMPALLLFAPFAMTGPRLIISKVGDAVGMQTFRQVGRVLVVGLVLVFFILNVGLYGSTVDEYHPNILIDKGRVMDSGNLAEKKYFWGMYYSTVYDLGAERWLESHGEAAGEYQFLQSRQVISGMYNCTGVSREPIVRQGTCDSGPTFPADRLNKIYSTAGSTVYYNRSADR